MRHAADEWLYPDRRRATDRIEVWHIIVASVIACTLWAGVLAVAAWAIWRFV